MLARVNVLQFCNITNRKEAHLNFAGCQILAGEVLSGRRLWRSNISFSIVLLIVYNLLQQVCTIDLYSEQFIRIFGLADFCDMRVGYDVFSLTINDFCDNLPLTISHVPSG